MKKLFVLGAILTVLAFSASAQDRGDRIRQDRMERGYDNGQLTRPEKHRLERDRHHFKSERRRDLRDGRISRHERKRLNKMRRHDRREAYRFKHNHHRRSL